MKKLLLSMTALVAAATSSAQTWTELPVVTNDYTSYATAKIQVDPVTQRPSVGFKGRQALAADTTDFNKGLVYEFIDGQWKQIAVGTDNVNSSMFDYQISPASSGVSHGYMAYYDDDSVKVKNYCLKVERIFRGAPTYQLGENGTTAPRVWCNDTIGQLGDFIKLPAAASYMGFNVITDYRATKSVVTAACNRTERCAAYDYSTNSWIVDTVQTVKSIQTHKAVQTIGPDGAIYVMSMLRGGNYDITVSKFDTEWHDLEFPNAAKNNATYQVFDITTDKGGNVYTLSVDAQDGIYNNAYVRKYDAVTKTWSYVGGESHALFACTDTHMRIDMVAMDDSTLVLAYSDPTDKENPYAVRTLTCDLKTNTWGEPEILPGVKASSTGDLTVAKSAAGDLYVAYVDDDSKIRVMHRSSVNNDIFASLTCDTLNAKTLGIAPSVGSAKQIKYSNEALGINIHCASYSYNALDKDTLGTTIFCDTIQAGFALSKASKARDDVNPGFVVTANPNHAIKSMRINWYVIASNIGREMDIYTSETPYEICSDLVDANKQGTKVTTVVENAEGYTDVTFEGNVHFFGFNTNSTGLFIRSIILGYEENELPAVDEAVTAVVAKINAIGTVEFTDACKALIDAAREAYDALTNEQKAKITAEQLKVLTDAEAKYAELKAAAEAAADLAAGLVNLDKDMFHTWTSAGTDAVVAESQAATWCDYVLNQSTGMPYGNGNVDWMQYADITGYKTLNVTVTEGTPRFFLNRKTANGQAPNDAIDTNNGDHFAAYVTKVANEDGTNTFTLNIAKIVKEQGFAHLNVIKGGNWANVTVTKMKLAIYTAVDTVLAKIDAIGTVEFTDECKAKIDEARAAYNALNDEQKAKISDEQLKVLTDAETEYEELKIAAEKAADLAAGLVNLDKDMFHTWTSAGADAVVAESQAATWCDYVLNQSTGMPYGNGNVDWMQYADITGYKALNVTVTEGTPRFFLNRKTANGQAPNDAIDTNNGDHFAAYVTKVANEDGTNTFTLNIAKIVKEQGFAHLNVIKGGNWANVTVTKMKLAIYTAVDTVLAKIDAIGTVEFTDECKAKIDEARAAYNALNDEQKAQISEEQYKVLTDAEAEYARLMEAAGISDVQAASAMKNGKFIQNGRIVVVKNGKTYGATGLVIE